MIRALAASSTSLVHGTYAYIAKKACFSATVHALGKQNDSALQWNVA